MAAQLLLYRLERLGCVNFLNSLWMTFRQRQITDSHSIEEHAFFAFEVVRVAVRDSFESDFDRRVEQERQIRLEIALHGPFQRVGIGQGRASPSKTSGVVALQHVLNAPGHGERVIERPLPHVSSEDESSRP